MNVAMRSLQSEDALLLTPGRLLPRTTELPWTDTTLALRILFCLISGLVIIPLMNITVLLSHLLKKYS